MNPKAFQQNLSSPKLTDQGKPKLMFCSPFMNNNPAAPQSCIIKSQNNNSVETPLGLVRKVKLNYPVPEGFRKLTIQQGHEIKLYLNKLLSQWSIVAFQTGKLDGFGYGNKFHDSYGQECGQLFVISICPQEYED